MGLISRRLAGALAIAAATPLVASAQSGITDLGGVSQAFGVSADGSVVVGLFTPGATHAFRWTSGGMVDLGTLGGTHSRALAVSANGSVVVGWANDLGGAQHAFRSSGGIMTDLGTLPYGPASWSQANAVSADGTVVVGESGSLLAARAFRWAGAAMTDLGTLPGHGFSSASGVSGDGQVVTGWSAAADLSVHRAFRWSGGVMSDLGTLGGASSWGYGISSDGSVIVGSAQNAAAATQAFRWTSAGGMVGLGTLGGTSSQATATSAYGYHVVGWAKIAGDAANRAFRWTPASGMQSVEDWLRASGVTVPVDITDTAYGISADGSVVVGTLAGGSAFVARGASGLVTLTEVRDSLGGAGLGQNLALMSAATMLHGAHSRPLARYVPAGRRVFWAAGDLGRDDHGARSGAVDLAEVGGGENFGPLQMSVSLGQTRARQDLPLNGRARSDATYVAVEALLPLRMDQGESGPIVTLGAYYQDGRVEVRRGYSNAGLADSSTGRPGASAWGLRARLDWRDALAAGGFGLTPYADLSYLDSTIDAYSESGGGFPARFDTRKDRATELRFGIHAARPLADGLRLLGTLEAAHRIERSGSRTTGQLIGLFGFDFPGQAFKRDWLRAGVGVEGTAMDGTAAVQLNLTTQGEAPSAWIAASWQKAF